MLAPVAGWSCNPSVIRTVPFTRGGAAPEEKWYSMYNWGVTVSSSDWRDVYICFISVKRRRKRYCTFTIELWLLLTRRVQIAKNNTYASDTHVCIQDLEQSCALCIVTIMTSRLLATRCQRLKFPPGSSDPPSRMLSLDPGGHMCRWPLEETTTIQKNYLRMTSSQPVKKRLPKLTIPGFRG